MSRHADRRGGRMPGGGVSAVRQLGPRALALVLAVMAAACGAAAEDPAPAVNDAVERFTATAYCTGRTTRSGARVRTGMAAADPGVLPLGSTIRIERQGSAYDGIYSVTDTGRAVRGRVLDLYVQDCSEAERFGRRDVEITVLRHGWDAAGTTPVGAGEGPAQ